MIECTKRMRTDSSDRVGDRRRPRRGGAAGPCAAQEPGAPTPKAVIYPGDVIRDDMLTDSPDGGIRDGGGPFVEDRALVVGKVARLTLLPGHAIPYAGVSNRKLVANGAEVKLIYERGRTPHHDRGRGVAGRRDRRRRQGAQQRQRRHRVRARCSRTARSGSAADEARRSSSRCSSA